MKRWLTLALDTPPTFWESLYPGATLDVGGHELHTYRVLQVDREHSRIQVEEQRTMKKKELRRRIRELEAELDAAHGDMWWDLPLEDRDRIVGQWITNRARRRAALGPFPRAFEDEINNAGVDLMRDMNRATF